MTTKQHHDDLVTAVGLLEGGNRETLESLWNYRLRVYSEHSFQAHTFYLGPAERGKAFQFVIRKQEEKANSDETKSKF